jgi:hypothetical protein
VKHAKLRRQASGKAVPATVLSYRGPSAKRGLVRPRPPACKCSRGGSPGQTASVCLAFQLEGAGRPCQQRFLSYPGTFRQAGLYGLAPPLAYASRGAVRVRRQVFVSRFQLEGAGRPCQQRFSSYPGTLPRSGGARARLRSRLHMLAGGDGPGQTASVCLAFQPDRAGRPCQHRFLSYPGDLPPSGGAGVRLAPPLAYARGGAVRVRRQVFVLALQLEGAGRPGRQTVSVVPGDLPPSGGGACAAASPPSLHTPRGAGRVRRQAFVSRFSWKERAGRAGNWFCRTRGPSAKRGCSASPRLQTPRGAVRVRRQVFVSRFSWKEREGRASNCFCLSRGTFRQAGARTASPACIRSWRQSGSDGKCLSRVSARSRDRTPRQIAAQASRKAEPAMVFRRTGGPSAKRGARTASPPRLHMLAGGQSGSDGKCLSRVSARRDTPRQLRRQRAGRCQRRFLSHRGTFRQAGGLYGLASLAYARGGRSGSDGKCLSRVSAGSREHPAANCGGGEQEGRASDGVCSPGDLPPSGGSYGLAPPLAHARGGQSGSDGKCLSRVSAWKP